MKIKLFLIILILVLYGFISANTGVVFDGDKVAYLNQMPAAQTIPYRLITLGDVGQLDYPVVFKPNKCTGCGLGVTRIDTPEEAQDYLSQTNEPIVAQKLDQRPREFSILYERYPLSTTGQVIAITEKIPLVQDEHFTVYKVGLGDRHSKVVDHSHLITPEFTQFIDKITQPIPNFYVGRYDVKSNSLNDLLTGNFGILELNGLMGLDLRSFINSVNEFDYHNALIQYRWFFKRVLIGLQANLVCAPTTIVDNLIREKYECQNYQTVIKKSFKSLIMGLLPLLVVFFLFK